MDGSKFMILILKKYAGGLDSMTKIRELYHESTCDTSSLMFVNDIIMQFPTEKGYRVESFFSPKFVRVSVYKEEIQ